MSCGARRRSSRRSGTRSTPATGPASGRSSAPTRSTTTSRPARPRRRRVRTGSKRACVWASRRCPATTTSAASIVADGEHVVTEHAETWHWAGGESVTLPFVSVQRVVDGTIVLWKDYWDYQTLMNAAPADWQDGSRRRTVLALRRDGRSLGRSAHRDGHRLVAADEVRRTVEPARLRRPDAGRASGRASGRRRRGARAARATRRGRSAGRRRTRCGRWASARCRSGTDRRSGPRPGWRTGRAAAASVPRGSSAPWNSTSRVAVRAMFLIGVTQRSISSTADGISLRSSRSRSHCSRSREELVRAAGHDVTRGLVPADEDQQRLEDEVHRRSAARRRPRHGRAR